MATASGPLVKYLDDMSEDEIIKLNIPTGVPLVYELDKDLRPIRHYYLGDAGGHRCGDERGGQSGAGNVD